MWLRSKNPLDDGDADTERPRRLQLADPLRRKFADLVLDFAGALGWRHVSRATKAPATIAGCGADQRQSGQLRRSAVEA
jgi:hypothetical protein